MNKIVSAVRGGCHKIKSLFYRSHSFHSCSSGVMTPAFAFAGAAPAAIGGKLHSKRGDSHLVAVVLVIIVTVALCIIFQQQVGSFFTTAFGDLKSAAATLFGFSGNN